MKRIFAYMKPRWLILVLVLFLKLAAAMLELQIPSALADIIDVGIPAAREAGNLSPLTQYGLAMGGFALAAFITNLTANIVSAQMNNKVTAHIRQDLFHKIFHLSARQIDQVTIPSAVSRLTSDTYNINAMFNRCLRMGVRAPILMIGGIAVTLFMDPVLTLTLVVALPLIVVLVLRLTRKAMPLFRQRQTILDDMVRTVQESASGIRVIKALSKTEYEKGRFDKVNGDLADKRMEASLVMSKTRPVSSIVLNFSLVCVVVLGALRVNGGVMLPGRIIAFINYFPIILNATLGISGIFMVLTNGLASAQRVSQVLEMPEDMTLADILPDQSDAAVEFRDVSFSYKGVENNISHLSFSLRKGQTLGIIGGTGSGKSTITNLLLRFYDPDEGQILLNGRDLRSIPNDELRRMFGVTFQNDFLMADTIEKNISFFRDLDPGEVRKAAVLAQAAEFIDQRDGGMDAMLTIRGNNLSGGQKQRLLIARALAGNPEILILDDASSALDYRTDADLRKALSESCPDTTKIVVAQRVSSIRNADLILVMEGGEVIGHGTHEELMVSCPTYQEIAQIQMESEEVEVHA